MKATVTLEVTEGALRGRRFVLGERSTCIVGRAADCSPRVPDDSDHRTISRHHCLLDINPPDIRVRDFGSLNGTYVNGVKIGQREAGQAPGEADHSLFPEYDLRSGDEIALGPTVLRVHIDAPESEPPGPALTPSDPGEVVRHLVDRAAGGEPALAALADYRLERELGRGGMGAVFLARHKVTGIPIAVKAMLPKVAADDRARERFLREAEVSHKLRHPHIASLYDLGSDGRTFFFTLEYCAGGSVHDLVTGRGGVLTVQEALPIAFQVLDGLGHAHRQGVVHRDLTPHNVLLQPGPLGEGPVAKVSDFGLAKSFDQAGLSGLTRTGSAMGKPYFMPRQQVINFKYSKPEVDVWALAACLYWMLTGAFPRDFPPAKDPWQVVLQDAPVPVRERNPAVPVRLAETLDQALRDRPAIGFTTAADLRHALEQT
ncbi:protein kinase domain-containing protein [Actinomadura alba]|uniref:non-specific serine/threonine protein kinase n=1 Tax=Actinomadura alba TaxID=406431 RepID=A0ABR7LQ37_9ACTN|nr:protein kinase [Actinomadura alba]MBC6466694.1 protein kinase [Actinomadura alba]